MNLKRHIRLLKKWKTKGLLNEHSFESIHQVMHGDEHEFVQYNKQPCKKLASMIKHQNVKEIFPNRYSS